LHDSHLFAIIKADCITFPKISYLSKDIFAVTVQFVGHMQGSRNTAALLGQFLRHFLAISAAISASLWQFLRHFCGTLAVFCGISASLWQFLRHFCGTLAISAAFLRHFAAVFRGCRSIPGALHMGYKMFIRKTIFNIKYALYSCGYYGILLRGAQDFSSDR